MKKKFLAIGLSAVLLVTLLTVGLPALASPGIIYVDVDATGANNGGSWGDAFNNLQQALGTVTTSDEIWVAEGTYKPGTSRTDSFAMKNGVAIYGGFSGTETARNQRDLETNITILSGDLNDNGMDNNDAYHVFYHPSSTSLNGTAILDGFTITGGSANGSDPHDVGGGMYNDQSSPTLTNCTFNGNTARSGGGMYNIQCSPTLTNCTFFRNTARSGGGMSNSVLSSPTVTNCTFSNNQATTVGGGMSNFELSSPTVTNCTFNGNTRGGMYNFNGPSPTVTNCIFFDNDTGMSNASAWPTVTNCTFIGNTGSGMHNFISSPTVTNCIFWANVPNQISAIESSPTVTYCDVQGGYPGTGNIISPPLLDENFHLPAGSTCIDAGNNSALPADTADLDNDGDTTEPIPYDYEGNPRRFDDQATPDTGLGTPPIVDMGAVEYFGTSDLHLTKAVSNNTPDVGETITFTIVLSNNGPDSATNVEVTDLLPTGLGYVSHTATQGTYDSGSGIWAVGHLANGASAQLDISATVDEEGTFLNLAQVAACDQADPDSTPNNYDEDDQAFGVVISLGAGGYQDTMPPCGSIHAHDNMLWPPNKKMVEVTLSGYVRDELSIARDGVGIGVSEAYLLINSEETIPLVLESDGSFSMTKEFQAKKGALYTIELYAADTTPVEEGGPNSGLVDQTYIRVP